VVRRYVDAIARRGIRPQAVYLYGSHARGQARRWSDIDLVVVWRGLRRMGYYRSFSLLGEAAGEIREPVQAIPYTPQQFANPIPGGFLEEILRDAVQVFAEESEVPSSRRRSHEQAGHPPNRPSERGGRTRRDDSPPKRLRGE
jgi:hypothetical protein